MTIQRQPGISAKKGVNFFTEIMPGWMLPADGRRWTDIIILTRMTVFMIQTIIPSKNPGVSVPGFGPAILIYGHGHISLTGGSWPAVRPNPGI